MTVTGLAAAYAKWRSSRVGRVTEQLERDLVLSLAGPLAGRRVLDAGTGDGTYAIEAAARGATTIGIDLDAAMLDAARRRARERHVEIGLVRAPIEAMPVDDGAIDVVLAITVLCFVENPVVPLREVARVLAPGGRCVLGELARWSTWAASRRVRGWLGDATWRRARFWSRGELVSLVESVGLRVVEVRGAVHFPRSSLAACAIRPFDAMLGRLHAPGAAFIALAAEK